MEHVPLCFQELAYMKQTVLWQFDRILRTRRQPWFTREENDRTVYFAFVFFDLYFTGMRWRNSEIVPNAARARYLASSQTSAGDTPGVTFGFNLGHALWNILYPSHRHGLATLLLIVLDPIPLKYAVTSPDLAMQLTLSCTQWASRPKISRGPLVYL